MFASDPSVITTYLYWGLIAYAMFLGWRQVPAHALTRVAGLVVFIVGMFMLFGLGRGWEYRHLLYGSFVGYAVFIHWRPTSDHGPIKLIWFLILPPIVFAGLWLSGLLTWHYFPYWSILGERYALGPPSAEATTSVALLVSVLVFARLATGRTGHRYRIVVLSGSIGLLAFILGLLGSRAISDFVSNIHGWSARGAVENRFNNHWRDSNPFLIRKGRYPNTFLRPPPLRIIEQELPADFQGIEQTRRFVIYSGHVKAYHVDVVPYGWWWWRIKNSESLLPSLDVFEKAEEQWSTNSDEATATLEAIIRDYPMTRASDRAEGLLEDLRSRSAVER